MAGNTASASATISLDKTPPTVSITSPADGSTSTASSISVTGNVSDALSGVASVTCNGIPATIQSATFTCSVSLAVGSNSITSLATDVAGNPYSATVSVTRSNPLSLTSLSPTSGPVGTSVTISGAGFGTTQGSSAVTFNGTPANPTSWSDTQILVPVPTGATTGPVIVTVSAQASNALTFGVGTPPTISASASPAPNAAGWNNSSVTVTFTCTAGSAPVATCPPPQLVLPEGANQPVSGTATDTDGTSTTTTIQLNIDKTKPVLTITSPSDGSTASSASQPIIGTVTDSLSGLSAVSCNGTSVPLSGGNFSCNISLNVGVNLIVVRATDVAGNVAGSNFHVSLPGTLPPPQTLTVTPSVANLVVGQTQILTAVDELGRPRDDATFTVSDPTIATISGDPTLTVVAPGPFTVTASVGGVSTSTSWNAATGPLPQGTILWSAPTPPPGWTVVQIVQAVPTANGPDLYSVENTINSDTLPSLTLVRGLTSDGRQLWQTQLNGLSQAVNAAMADGNGGIIVELDPDFSVRPLPNAHVVNLDAQTGAVVWNLDTGSPFSEVLNGNQAVGPDGTLYSFLTPAADGATGAPVSSPYSPVQVPNSSATIQVAPQNPCSSITKSFPPGFAPPTIDADGSVLTLTAQSNLVYTSTCTGTGSLVQLSATYYLARVTPSGSYTLTPYYTQTNANILSARPAPQLSPYACLEVFIQTTFEGCRVAVGTNSLIVQSLAPTVQPFRPIPDGQGGALIPARIQDPNNPGAALAHVFHIPSSGNVVDIVLPLPAPGVQQTILNTGTRNFDLVLGENNVAFATDGINLASFDFTTGQTLWSYVAPSQNTASFMYVRAWDWLVAKITDRNAVDTLLPFDASGNLTLLSQIPQLTQTSYSWKGNWNLVSSGATSAIELPNFPINFRSDWAQPHGSSSSLSLAITHHTFGLFWCGSAFGAQGYVPNSPCPQGGGDDIQWSYYPLSSGISGLQNFAGDHPEWVNAIVTEAFNAFQKAYIKYGIQVQVASQTNQQPDQEFTAYVLGDSPFPGAGKTFLDSSSAVYYFALMEGGQQALGQPSNPTNGAGWINFSPSYPPSDANSFLSYIRAIGQAIGNSAAHEMGHHLERITNIPSNKNLRFPLMDCGLGGKSANQPVPIACEKNDNFVYNFFSADGHPQDPADPFSTGGMFFYGVPGGQLGIPPQPAIHWGPSNACWLQNYVFPEGCGH